jgi:hypothetical protein
MIIIVNCPGCKKRYDIDGTLAGKKSRCRQCGEIFRIPVPTARLIEPDPAAPAAATASIPPRNPSPTPAPAAQPAWTATPLMGLLEGHPAPPGRAASDRRVPAAARASRGVEPAVTMPPRAAPAPKPRAASPELGADLPAPPRAGYRAANRRSRDAVEDTELGITAFGWYILITSITLVGYYIYIGAFEPEVETARRVYLCGRMVLIPAGLALAAWGTVWLLVAAFRQDMLQGLLCLFLPFYGLFFIAARWNERRGLLGLTGAAPLMLLVHTLLALFVSTAMGDRLANYPGMIRFADSGRPSVARSDGGPAIPTGDPGSPAPRPATGSRRKADAEQVRNAESIVRQEIQLINGIAGQLATVHDGFGANRVGHQIRFQSMFARGAFRGANDVDLGPNETVALKHRVGRDVVEALNALKAQCSRIQSIPGLQGFIKPDAISRIDGLIAQWTIRPGEDQMPDLVEPPAGSTGFGPRGRFPGAPPSWPGRMGPGMPRMGMPPNLDALITQYRQDLQGKYGDRVAVVRVTGIRHGGDPPAGDVTEAIQKRVKELAPGIAAFQAATINDQFVTVVAPVDDVQGLASGIDFGTVTVKESTIEVQLDDRWASKVPRKPAAPQPVPPAGPSPAADPDVPAGADAITRSLIELKSSDGGKRKHAVERLQRSAPDGRVDQVVEALLPMLEDDDSFLAIEVAKALTFWRSPEAMQGLIGRTRDNRHFVRSAAIKALGWYHERKAAEAVVSVLKEDGFAVDEALKSMGADVAEPALIPLLRSPDAHLRREACRLLADLGGMPTLLEMQSLPPDPDGLVRMAAQDAWKKIVARVGPPPRPARGKTGKSTGNASGR